MDKYKNIALNQLNELKQKYNNTPYDKNLCESLKGYNYSNDFFDFNYKDIAATIINNNGFCLLSGNVDLYINDIWFFNFNL